MRQAGLSHCPFNIDSFSNFTCQKTGLCTSKTLESDNEKYIVMVLIVILEIVALTYYNVSVIRLRLREKDHSNRRRLVDALPD